MTPAEKLAKEIKGKKAKSKLATRPVVFTCNLRGRRECLGIGICDVAKYSGTHNTTLGQIEEGAGLSLATAFKLAAFYGVKIEDIWTPTEAGDE